jgi:hypothetical protein
MRKNMKITTLAPLIGILLCSALSQAMEHKKEKTRFEKLSESINQGLPYLVKECFFDDAGPYVWAACFLGGSTLTSNKYQNNRAFLASGTIAAYSFVWTFGQIEKRHLKSAAAGGITTIAALMSAVVTALHTTDTE